MTGFMFQDCGEYTYVEEVVKKTENKVILSAYNMLIGTRNSSFGCNFTSKLFTQAS